MAMLDAGHGHSTIAKETGVNRNAVIRIAQDPARQTLRWQSGDRDTAIHIRPLLLRMMMTDQKRGGGRLTSGFERQKQKKHTSALSSRF